MQPTLSPSPIKRPRRPRTSGPGWRAVVDSTPRLEGWLTTTEACELTGLYRVAIHEAVRRGELTGRRVGPLLVVSEAEVLALRAAS